jgi:hypothetical protein
VAGARQSNDSGFSRDSPPRVLSRRVLKGA